MEIIDEHDEHEEDEKNKRQNENENRVISETIKRKQNERQNWAMKIKQRKLGLENHFSYFFKGKKFPSNGVK